MKYRYQEYEFSSSKKYLIFRKTGRRSTDEERVGWISSEDDVRLIVSLLNESDSALPFSEGGDA